MAKPVKPFEVPKNNDHEPALSTTLDPYDYESGSGKTYHDKKKPSKAKEEGPKKPEPIAGMEESTETAGTTTLWKINAGDSPKPEPKVVKDTDAEAVVEKETSATKETKTEKTQSKSEKAEKAAEKAAEEKEATAKAEKGEKTETAEKTEKADEDSKSFAQKFGLNVPVVKSFLQMESELEAEVGCEPAIDVSQKQLDIELDYFSRNFDLKHYKKAMQVYGELKKQGKDPKVNIHTWELYDAAFSFPRVRRYDLVQKHMDLIQHFQDNLNENFTNKLHLDNFVRVAKAAQEALNEKYHDGEFADPAGFDPVHAPDPTWATVTL